MVPPPLEASVLLTTMPWDGADHWEKLELDAAMEQSGLKVLHTLIEEVGPSLLSTLLPPTKALQCP